MISWLSVMTGYSVASTITPHTISDLLGSEALWVLWLDAYSNAAAFFDWCVMLFFMVSPVIFFLAIGWLILNGVARRISHI